VADDIQIRFSADGGPAIHTIDEIKAALANLAPALNEFSSSSLRVFRDQMQILVDLKEATTQQALGFDMEYTAQLRDQEAQRLEAVISSDSNLLEEKMAALTNLSELDAEYTGAVTADQRRLADEARTQAQAVQRSYEAAFDRLGSSVQRIFNDIVTHQTSWAKGSVALIREVETFFLRVREHGGEMGGVGAGESGRRRGFEGGRRRAGNRRVGPRGGADGPHRAQPAGRAVRHRAPGRHRWRGAGGGGHRQHDGADRDDGGTDQPDRGDDRGGGDQR